MQCHENEPQKTCVSCADPAGNELQDTLQKDEENRVTSPSIQDLIGFTPMPLKRSKRENSVDENTRERAERLKAIKNLDWPGTSKCKSFLSYSDSCLSSTIDRLGVSLRRDIDHSVNHIKRTEFERLHQAAIDKQVSNFVDSDNELDCSDDSDVEQDQRAIQYLVGDIAEDILGTDRSPSSGFKPGSRKIKSSSSKRKMKKLGHQIKRLWTLLE
jgi:hypothetical protein